MRISVWHSCLSHKVCSIIVSHHCRKFCSCLFGNCLIHLQFWVKVTRNWTNPFFYSAKALKMSPTERMPGTFSKINRHEDMRERSRCRWLWEWKYLLFGTSGRWQWLLPDALPLHCLHNMIQSDYHFYPRKDILSPIPHCKLPVQHYPTLIIILSVLPHVYNNFKKRCIYRKYIIARYCARSMHRRCN